MKPGDRCIVFTASGTFTRQRGVIASPPTTRDVRVLLDGELQAMTFERLAVVPVDESSRHVGGAE